MANSRHKLIRQLVLLIILILILITAGSMIYLGATIFRSQIPLFQLIDGDTGTISTMDPEPTPYSGVVDLTANPSVRLYLILGSDYRPESGYRTDVIMLVALDTLTGKVSLVSFPRDLWVTIPGYGENRLNTVMQLGGFQLMANTLQMNFGVYPTGYALIDMDGFLQVIDVLGGVEIETEYATADACDGSLEEDRWCEVGPGTFTLDSDWALWYVRARYNSSDFDRMRRTQEVVQAVMKRVIGPSGLLKLPTLMKIYQTEVESNVSTDSLLPLLRLAIGFDSDEDIRHFSIGANQVTSWTTSSGASVLLPDTGAIQAILQEALSFD